MAKLEDVARQAGVSISTVSRVFNDPGLVNVETRARVERVIRKLKYRPSRVARRLRTSAGRAHILGLIIPDIQNPFYSNIVRGIEDVAYIESYAVILCSSDEDPERERFYLDILHAESADGIILPPLHEDGRSDIDLSRVEVPFVCFDRRPDVPADVVVVDNRRGARQVTEHLIQRGHERIGLIVGPLSLSTSTERLEGYRDALHAHGLPFDDALTRSGPPTREAGYAMTEQLLDECAPPATALFTANNQLTLGALDALRARQLQVPNDLALAGFDDPPWARHLAAPLTTVRQPAYEMGRRAAELLLQRIADLDRPPVVITLQPSLIVRQSCGSP